MRIQKWRTLGGSLLLRNNHAVSAAEKAQTLSAAMMTHSGKSA
jgi:hypothetical protein